MGKQYATRHQQRRIEELLQEHCRKDGAFAVYEEGWSDQRIADQIGCTRQNVHSIRLEDYGNLRRGTADAIDEAALRVLRETIEFQGKTIESVGNRAQLLATRITNLEHDLAALRVQVAAGSAASVLDPTLPWPVGGEANGQ